MAITRGDQQVAPIHTPSLLAKAGYGYKAAFRLHLLISLKKRYVSDSYINLMLTTPVQPRLR